MRFRGILRGLPTLTWQFMGDAVRLADMGLMGWCQQGDDAVHAGLCVGGSPTARIVIARLVVFLHCGAAVAGRGHDGTAL